MQEELLQFKLQKVWTLVDLPNGKRAIGTKWVFKNKKDKIGIEVYVCQPPGFEDPHFPDKVYKVEKSLYGLHKAPKAWYETLSTYLIENGFKRGTIDKTLFIKKDKGDILLVQMSFMGELTFFLGLQVQQKEDGIFISQDIYVAEILKKLKLQAKRITKISQSSGPIYLVTNETIYKEWEDIMERAATTASSLEAEQDSGSGPRCQDTILEGAEVQSRIEAASK
ncbi:putative ribonuclease H-like domain-containing protein [Tanacetum coccineum]